MFSTRIFLKRFMCKLWVDKCFFYSTDLTHETSTQGYKLNILYPIITNILFFNYNKEKEFFLLCSTFCPTNSALHSLILLLTIFISLTQIYLCSKLCTPISMSSLTNLPTGLSNFIWYIYTFSLTKKKKKHCKIICYRWWFIFCFVYSSREH